MIKNKKSFSRKIIITTVETMMTSTIILPVLANASQINTYEVSNEAEFLNEKNSSNSNITIVLIKNINDNNSKRKYNYKW